MVVKQGNVHLDRQKALVVLREIVETTKHQISVGSISLNQDRLGDFVLKIECGLTDNLPTLLRPILAKHSLELKQETGFVIIYSKC